VIGWLLCAVATVLTLAGQLHWRPFALLAIAYFSGVAFLRGPVGTDTGFYEDVFARILAGNSEWIWEGAFGALGVLLCEASGSVEIGVRLVSLVFFALLAIFLYRADQDEAAILTGYILPVYGYQLSMNTLRVGIAMALLLVVVQALRRGPSYARAAGLLLPVLFHFSSAIASGFIVLAGLRISLKGVLAAIAALGIIGLILFNVQEYLLAKQDLYAASISPSELSGLSRLILLALLGLGIIYGALPFSSKSHLLLLLLICIGAIHGISGNSLATPRLLELLAFCFPASALLVYGQHGTALDSSFKTMACCAGAFGAVAVARNFLEEAAQGNTPFLPYTTWL
jgi:hypothetical protein